MINLGARLAFTFIIWVLSYFHHLYDITSFFSKDKSVNEHNKCNQDSLSTRLILSSVKKIGEDVQYDDIIRKGCDSDD